jgi:hypothetical protein
MRSCFLPSAHCSNVASDAKKPIIFTHDDRAVERILPTAHHLHHPPFARLGHDKTVKRACLERTLDLASETAGVVGVIETNIPHRLAGILKLLREMPHGGEDEGELLLVMLHIGSFLGHLAHQDDIILLPTIARLEMSIES